jgi:hypothetical protein
LKQLGEPIKYCHAAATHWAFEAVGGNDFFESTKYLKLKSVKWKLKYCGKQARMIAKGAG